MCLLGWGEAKKSVLNLFFSRQSVTLCYHFILLLVILFSIIFSRFHFSFPAVSSFQIFCACGQSSQTCYSSPASTVCLLIVMISVFFPPLFFFSSFLISIYSILHQRNSLLLLLIDDNPMMMMIMMTMENEDAK